MHLRDLTVGPPGSWKFTEPRTNYTILAVTFPSLVSKVAVHRKNNSIPLGENLSAEIEDAICRSLDTADQISYCGEGQRLPRSVPWQHVESFLKTTAAFLTGDEPLVLQEEAERRAAICVACPLNVGLSGCGVCRSAIDVFRKTLLKRSTSHDAGLQACGVCGCENKTQVHMPIKALRAGADHDYSANPKCWKLRGGVNETTQ